jgi:hypothetical protein
LAGHGKKNTDALLLPLAAGASPAEAARQASCSERTVRRRLQEPGFRARVDAMRAELIGNAVGRLAVIGTLAADTLHRLLGSSDEKIKLGAARAALGFMLQSRDYEVLAADVAKLKEQVEKAHHARNGYHPPQGDSAGPGPDGGDHGSADAAGSDPARPGEDNGHADAGQMASGTTPLFG